MIRPYAPLACAALVAGALACTSAKVSDATDPATVALPPAPTAPGAAMGSVTSGAITRAGGTLATPDGALSISVPAGALDADATLTIAPIANTARGAVGNAFRLGPEGSTFATPVTLTFQAPSSYPSGAGLEGVGIAYQDESGYWHEATVVARDAGASTVTVTTTHFSDWAVTWQTDTASAEGTIALDQTVGTPFHATGVATLFFQGDDASDTTYLLTGTLTLTTDTITIGDETCVPDQLTKTLPLSVAEIHKSDPPVFRWGIGAYWTLACTTADGGEVSRLMPALFDTMFINLTRCDGGYADGQVATSDLLQGAYTSDCGSDGTVSATWSLSASWTG